MAEKERQSFEDALSRLKEIVTRLEDESISLEESIELYEQGIALAKDCTQTLEEAELRIEKVNDEISNQDTD